ncbi:MAG: Ldh family oxidoreductase [Pseudomonadota bacterium]|nr:Ldh family oxidoreductase [Pseudomonadota bacterium]
MERFDHVRVAEPELRGFVRDLVGRTGVNLAQVEAVTRAVLDASARGVDTHGVRLVPAYVLSALGGRINLAAVPRFERVAPAVGMVDGDDGFGHLASFLAIDEGVQLARESGIGAVVVRRSSHHGATGCYTHHAARQGLLAIGMTHADAQVVPHGGTKPFFGTNPLSFAAPVPDEPPIVIDMATSAVPLNRVFLWAENDMPLRPQVGLDAAGEPAGRPEDVTMLLPLGGLDFGYKGTCLATMVDLLCAGLSGMRFGAELDFLMGPAATGPVPIGHFFVLIDAQAFGFAAHFGKTAARMLEALRAVPGRDGAAVLAPGDIERHEALRRRDIGIPVDRHTWAAFEELGRRFELALPRHGPAQF